MSFGLGRASANAATPEDDDIDSSTPWIAASDGDLPLLQKSLARLQLPVTTADDNGYTLLQAAASYSQLPVMDWLLSTSRQQTPDQTTVLVSAVDQEGDSALHYASTVDAVKRLIDAGIDVHHKNQAGKTALEHKQEELENLMEEAEDENNGDDEDDGNEDDEARNLREVIAYLSSLPTQSQ